MNLKRRAVVVSILFFTPFGADLRGAIIGADDRREWYEIQSSPELQLLSESTAILIRDEDSFLVSTNTHSLLSAQVPSHGYYDSLCPGERYTSQPAPGNCSGFLVGPDVLITARHCLNGRLDRDSILFGFRSTQPGEVPAIFPAAQVRRAVQTLAEDPQADWSIVRLDQPVARPLYFKLRTSGAAKIHDPVTVLGYPRGLPLKIAAGATVHDPVFGDPTMYFEADLDVFGGNSGSPVIQSNTHLVEGMLIVGFGEFEDWETDPATQKPCRRLRRMPYEQATFPWVLRSPRIAPSVSSILG